MRETYPEGYLDDLDLRLKAAKQISANARVRKAKGKPGISGRIHATLAEAWPPRRPLKILKTWATSHLVAHDLRDQFRPDADFIICGHTHRAVYHRRAGKHSINTGAFLPLAGSLVVEIGDGKLKLMRAKSSSRVYHLRDWKQFEF